MSPLSPTLSNRGVHGNIRLFVKGTIVLYIADDCTMRRICLSCFLVGLAGAFLSPSYLHRESAHSLTLKDDHDGDALSRRSMLLTASLMVPVVGLLPLQASAKVRMNAIYICVPESRIDHSLR